MTFWHNSKGFRDILIHRYDAIVIERVWDAVEKLVILQAAVAAMLEAVADDEQ